MPVRQKTVFNPRGSTMPKGTKASPFAGLSGLQGLFNPASRSNPAPAAPVAPVMPAATQEFPLPTERPAGVTASPRFTTGNTARPGMPRLSFGSGGKAGIGQQSSALDSLRAQAQQPSKLAAPQFKSMFNV